MDLATKKLEIIQLILSLEEGAVLDYVLAYLESWEDNLELEKNYVPKSETDKLLADYNEKIAGLKTDEEIEAVLSQYTDDEKLTILLLLRAKDARENRDESREASKVFARIRKRYNYAEKV